MVNFNDVVFFYHDGEVAESMEEVMGFFLVNFGVRVHAIHKAGDKFAVFGIAKDDVEEFRSVLKLEHNLIYDFYEVKNCNNDDEVKAYALNLHLEGF